MAGLFPPQEQAWNLDTSAGLTPKAMEKVCRESVLLTFDLAAESINEDWDTTYDGKQMQRWSESVGRKVADLQEAERKKYAKSNGNKRPSGPANAPQLLAVGMDAGRVQGRCKDEKTASRWKEDKVATISSYRKGEALVPGQKPTGANQPRRLVSTYAATMADSRTFGVLAKVEAERRGLREALEVIVIGDGAAWIDTIADEHFPAHERILDYYHAAERLSDCVKGAYPLGFKRLDEALRGALHEGRVARVIDWLQRCSERLGAPEPGDAENHPRRVLAENLGYFQRHRDRMDYPRYRANGWPIGSGVIESGVKLFNKRVKGTEQFWNTNGAARAGGVEPILALRSLRLSQDDRWRHYMLYGELLRRVA